MIRPIKLAKDNALEPAPVSSFSFIATATAVTHVGAAWRRTWTPTPANLTAEITPEQPPGGGRADDRRRSIEWSAGGFDEVPVGGEHRFPLALGAVPVVHEAGC